MLIPKHKIIEVLKSNGIIITGAFHIGAHECEELDFYHHLGFSNDDIIWVDAIDAKVREAKNRGIPHIYTAVITDKDDENVTFHVSNNVQSSSVLEFKTHAVEHPHVRFIGNFEAKSITINSFVERNNIQDFSKYNFWNFDIQGAELMALKGASQYIQNAKALYLEVNEKELYEGCGLIGDIDALLLPYGFKRVLTEMTQHGWGDALYIVSQV